MEALESPGRIRFDDVEDPEQNESGESTAPADGHEGERDQHADHFVDHDRPGIDATEIFLSDGSGPGAEDEQACDQPCFEKSRLCPPDERIDQEPGGRAHRSWRNGKISTVPDGCYEDSEAGHAFTTRVSARRSWRARRSEWTSAGTKP